MATLDDIREAVQRQTDEDGVIMESPIPDGVPLVGTIAEVTSLSPPMAETLAGRSVKVKAYVGPVPLVGQIILLVRINRWWLAITGITVV